MLGNNLDNSYSRGGGGGEHDIRYSHMNGSIGIGGGGVPTNGGGHNQLIGRSLTSYPGDGRIGLNEYDVSNVHSTNSRPYDPGAPSAASIAAISNNTQTAFERYDPNYLQQRQNMYASYAAQPTLEELNNQQKYMLEQQQHLCHPAAAAAAAMMKMENSDENNSGPVYPRPMYHYDPTCTPLPPGFSAINLSVKVTSAQTPFKGSSPSPSSAPIIDLSTSSITSSSPHGFNSTHYKLARSPQPGSSPHLASPQVPSPQGQTLDLSVNRLPNR